MADKQEFKVKVRDRHEGTVSIIALGEHENITSQEAAELYVFTMPTSYGGKHPGLDVSPADKAKFDAALAEWQKDNPDAKPKGETF